MDRKHKDYFIASGIVYLVLCVAYKTYIFENQPILSYQIYNYLLIFTLIIAFIFGIRNNVRAMVIWLGIICGDFLLYLHSAIVSIYSLELANVKYVFSLVLIIAAIVCGFKSLNIDTIKSEDISKVYIRPAIVFFIFAILYDITLSISAIAYFWYLITIHSTKFLQIFNYSIGIIIIISVTTISILKILKKETFGFVLATVLLVWNFLSFLSTFFGGNPLGFAFEVILNNAVRSNPILLFFLKLLSTFWYPVFISLLICSLILLINFLFHLRRDPELIAAKGNAA